MQGLCSIIGLFADYSISLLLYESIMHVHVSAGEMKKKIKERWLVRRGRERGDQRRRGGEVVDFHQEKPSCCYPQRV
jgi:hypothetical protein